MNAEDEEKAIAAIASFLSQTSEQGGASAADRAALRRRGEHWPKAMWVLLTMEPVEAWLDGVERAAGEAAMALVARTGAEAGRLGGEGVGTMLARSGYSEDRLSRLLRAETLDELALQAGLVARWAMAKGEPLRLAGRGGLGPFLVARALGLPRQRDRARDIARDYYRTPSKPGTEAASTEADRETHDVEA